MTDRTSAAIRAIAAAIITIAGLYGFQLPFADDEAYELIYSAIVCLAYLIVEARIWWKNNNWTPQASRAQLILDAEKAGDEEVIQAVDDIIAGIHERAGIEDADE